MTRKFEVNVPQEVALKFPTGKHVPGRFGEQALFTLTDGSVMYVPLKVEQDISKLGIQPGEVFGLVKRQVANGQKKETRWEVNQLQAPRKPQAAAALLNGSSSLDGLPDDPALQTKLEHALKTALHAAKQAEAYSLEIGRPVQFDKNDIRSMALTLVINGKGRAA